MSGLFATYPVNIFSFDFRAMGGLMISHLPPIHYTARAEATGGYFGATYPNRKRAIRKPLSEETKKKIGEGNKGKISWSKGKKKSEETLKKMKESQANRRTKEKMNVSND